MNPIQKTTKPCLPRLRSVSLLKATGAVSVLLVTCLLWLSAPALAGELEDYPQIGPTPPLVLKDLGGNTHTLDDYRGRIVLLNFWATWCTPCLIEMPDMQRLDASFPDAELTVLAVNVKESREKAWRFQQLLDVNFTVLLDTAGLVARDWNVAMYPTSYLIDTSGQIRYVVFGALDWDSPKIKQVIETLRDRESDQPPVLTKTIN